MSNATSAELPRNKLTFLDKLKIGVNILPLRKYIQDLHWDTFALKPYSSGSHYLGTAEITIYNLWKIQKLEAHCP